ncbi:hypothetical protein EIN_179790, partial [Entamoeba invadens IP1]|uniref:hypothetical protein n=1 Tax=Entamoeba invadens IP1 TaxID=370355 RepID=UPI0002C3F9C9
MAQKSAVQKRIDALQISSVDKAQLQKEDEELRDLQKEINEMQAQVEDEERKAIDKESISSSLKPQDLKGSFKLSVRRERSKTAVIKLREKAHETLPITDYSADFEKRKKLEIARHAEKIENILKNNENIPTEDVIDQIASVLNEFHEEFDGDSLSPKMSTAELLKTTNYESIHLRKTSTAFRVTSKIVPGDITMRDVEETAIIHFEKTILEMSEQAAAIAACSEDALCFGSLVLVNKDDKSFSTEFYTRCETLRQEVIKLFDLAKAAIDEPITMKDNDVYPKEIVPFVNLLEKSKSIVTKTSLEPVVDQAMVAAFSGKGTQIKAGQVEKKFYDNALAVQALTSELIVLAGTIAKVKPSTQDQNIGKTQVSPTPLDLVGKPITLSSNVFEKEKLLYIETSDLLVRLINILSGYINAVATAHRIASMEKPSSSQSTEEDQDPLGTI